MATHIAKPLGSVPGINHGFYVFTPDVVPQRLIISFHGFGQRGNGTTDLGRVLNEALALEIKLGRVPGSTPAVIISPQYADDSNDKVLWGETDKLIKWACDTYKIPRYRVTITGISGGGVCCMEYLYNYKQANPEGDPKSVSIMKAVLVASCWLDANRANRFGVKTYIWFIHGTGDTTCRFVDPNNPMNGAKPFYEAYRALGGRARMTAFPWLGHVGSVWNTAYAQQEVKDWILKYN